MTIILQLVSIGLLFGVMGISFGMIGQIAPALVCVVGGLFWAATSWFGLYKTAQKTGLPPEASKKTRRGGDPFIDNFAMFLFFSMAAWGIWQGLPAWLMLVVTLLTLASWDLGRFSYRMVDVIDEPAALRMEQTHLKRLGFTLAAGLFIGILPLWVRIPLDFGWALVLGLIAMIALNRFSRGIWR